MAITVNLRYTGKKGAAQAFAHEMISSGTVEKSIEYTGKEQFKHYKTMEFRRKHGGWATYDVPTLIPFYEYK